MRSDTRVIVFFVLLFALPAAGFAESFAEMFAPRWEGIWVVTRTELYSDCQAHPTPNDVKGPRVVSDGARRFAPGELAVVLRVRVPSRARVVVLDLELAEPLLVNRPKGRFTLYEERRCGVELRLEVPPKAVKNRQIETVERLVSIALQRFATEGEARASDLWNRRRRKDYPEGYATTLAEYHRWQNAWIEKTLPAVRELAWQNLPRWDEEGYLAEFTWGLRDAAEPDCDDLIGKRLAPPIPYSDMEGSREGRAFGYALGMLRRLQQCRRPVEAAAAPPRP